MNIDVKHLLEKNNSKKIWIFKCFQMGFIFQSPYQGENTVKGAKGAKVKVIFQGLHMTHVVFVLVYNFKFYILSTPFNTTF
jgi:hypothetical protein